MSRRALLTGLGAAAALGALALPALRRGGRDTLKIGYLHTLAVDGQLWLADHMGWWKKHGLSPTFIQFTTGLELFQAMIGGSIDILTTGAVISNFPARGQGRAFLINNIEYATAQLWVNPAAGVSDWSELKGRRISTPRGTTAHVFLDRALRAKGLVPDRDVEIINQRMSEAVTSFISGAVPAVALWVPFNIPVRTKLPGARMLVDASAFYPEAAIMGGWATTGAFMQQQPDVLRRIIAAWVPANDFLISQPEDALGILQERYYPGVPLNDLKEQFKAQKNFSSRDWVTLYRDGTVANWLQQVTDFYISVGGIESSVPAKDYFATEFYLDVIESSRTASAPL